MRASNARRGLNRARNLRAKLGGQLSHRARAAAAAVVEP
jgi:hypothetical protein